MTFSEVLSELRRGRGLSQRQAAADLGVSQAMLSHYENGLREPNLAFIDRACRYYNVTADELLGFNISESKLSQTEAEELSSDPMEQTAEIVELLKETAIKVGGAKAYKAAADQLNAAILEIFEELAGQNGLPAAQAARSLAAMQVIEAAGKDHAAEIVQDEKLYERILLLRMRAEKILKEN